MLLVDGKAQVQQFKLPIVAIEKISAGRAVLASTPHVLAQAVERGTLLGVPLGVIAVCVLDVVLQRRDPVDLVCGLQRHRQHRHLRHLARVAEPRSRGADGGQRV